MPYKIHKLIEDKRNHTCGYVIPNGGFYWVVEMTFENHKQLTNLSERPGYSVDFVEGKEGFFDVDGYAVDPHSLVINKFSKAVESYNRLTRKYRGKDKEIKEEHKSSERERAIRVASSMGLRVSNLASTQFIKTALGRVKSPVQHSLSSSLN